MSPNSIPQNLLIIEDSIGDARLLKELLRETDFREYETTFVHTLDELDVFSRTKFQAILLDLHLSDVKPIDTFRKVNKLFSSTPIIVLTGLKDDALAARIVRAGAQDYLIKGTYDGDTLQRSLKYAVYRKKAESRIAKQKQASQKLKHRADSFESESIRLANVNKAKDVFLSIASHQLRTPATAVKQYVGMVLGGYAGEIDQKQRQFLETAYQSNERQLKIVDDLLRVAKLDAGHVTLRKEFTDINKLLHNIIEDMSVTVSAKHQKIYFEALDKETIASVDANNIRMVFENLLDNASKYSNEHTEIKVVLKKKDTAIHCDVIDTGIGISVEDQQKLFQKFSRVDDSFIHAPNGSGLGLYWAKEIVKLHDGDIALTSTKGKGSVFRVTLPEATIQYQE